MSFNKIEQKLKEFSIDEKTDYSINANEQIKAIENEHRQSITFRL